MNTRPVLAACAATVLLSLHVPPVVAQDPVTTDPPTTGTTPATTPPESKPAPSVARTDLPEARSIVNKAIEAMGGDKAINSVESSMIKATMSTPMGDLALDMSWMKPGMVLIKQSMTGMDSTMGSDGSVSWVSGPQGFQILEPEQAKQMKEQANMFRIVARMRDEAKELKTVDQLAFGDRETFKVSATDTDGNEQFAFFDVQDHLIRGIEATQDTQMGPVTSTIRFGEWKEDAGLKYFSKIEIEQMGMTMSLVFNEVKFNTLDPSVFALPAEVQAMLKAREGATSKPAETAPAPTGTGGGH